MSSVLFNFKACYNYFMEELFVSKKWYKRRGYILALIFTVIILFLLIFFGLKVLFLVRKISRGEITIPEKVSQSQLLNTNSSSLEKFDVDTEDDPSLGPKGAVTIVEFSDFECPLCREAFPIIREMVNLYGNKIRYVYRDFPVSDIHPKAEKAALAGKCANEQGKFWAYHDKLFLNQENLGLDDLKLYARQVGLNENFFNDCLDSGEYENEVKQDFNDGLFAGLRGTPTWFIEGVKVEGVIPAETFKIIIDEQIEIKNKL